MLRALTLQEKMAYAELWQVRFTGEDTMDETRSYGMVQDSGGDSDKGIERDAGWQAYYEAGEKHGAYDYVLEYAGTTLYVVFHFDSEYGYEGDPDQYASVDKVFIGDDQKLFNITYLLEDVTLEDIAIKIQAEIENEIIDAE